MAAHRTSNATVAAHGATSITPNDSTVFQITRALYIGTAGDLAVRMADGNTITFASVAIGIFPIQVDKILSTGTTAASIVALY